MPRSLTRQPGSDHAFTMVELLVAISILAVLTGTAYPYFYEMKSSFTRNSVRSQLEFDVKRAKSEAVKSGTRAVMTIRPDGAGYSIGLDITPYSSPGAIDAGQTIFTRTLPRGFTVSTTRALIFDSRGYVISDVGVLGNTDYSLSQNGQAFLSATVYPTGYIQYN